MRVELDVPLAPRTTLGLGGNARRFARVEGVDELRAALADAAGRGERVLILGSGSNLVVSDEGWDGLVIQLAMDDVLMEARDDHAIVTAAAGADWDALVARTIDARLAGVECLSGIPGLVGATPMQNVGAYGQEVADTIESVRALDRTTGVVETLAPAACDFGYRTSKFKGSERWIILDVSFRLPRSATSMPIRYAELARALGIAEGARAPLADVRRTVIELRRGKGMVLDPADPESRSAGSFFTNPIVDAAKLAELHARLAGGDGGATPPSWPLPGGATKLSAAWLIERAGFSKGYTVGRVGISTKHALALVNRGGATARELLALAREIQDRVRDRLGIELTPEPVIV
jgi:UDP-N-acetylmuramate dehydrogenase